MDRSDIHRVLPLISLVVNFSISTVISSKVFVKLLSAAMIPCSDLYLSKGLPDDIGVPISLHEHVYFIIYFYFYCVCLSECSILQAGGAAPMTTCIDAAKRPTTSSIMKLLE